MNKGKTRRDELIVQIKRAIKKKEQELKMLEGALKYYKKKEVENGSS